MKVHILYYTVDVRQQILDVRTQGSLVQRVTPYSVRGSEGYKAMPARLLQGRGLAKNPKLFVKFGAIRQTLISAC